jgi:CRISPR-associated endonuclease/helicase Cas3
MRLFPAPVLEDARAFVATTAGLLLSGAVPQPVPSVDIRQASWLLAGLAVAADWLGSNIGWFPYRSPELAIPDYWRDVAVPQAIRAVKESGLVPAAASVFRDFQNLFPSIPFATPLQEWAATTPIGLGPQLFVLEELTGAGKTEAALTLAARLTAAGMGQGVYLALPTMATADAMFDRVRAERGNEAPVWRRFFAAADAQLALAHSADRLKLRLEEAGRREMAYGGVEDETASRQCSAWLADSRKKALLADFAVGTIDQALLAVLPARHQSLRLLGLADKVLIVDEVHACDCYMGELLSRLLRFHAALGGSVILLSATLPMNQRKRYLQAFAQGASLAAQAPSANDYPLATRLSSAGLTEQPIAARSSVSRSVIVELVHEESLVIARLEEKLAQGHCVAWIRNTVADATTSWQEWNIAHPDCPATLYHARFALTDRLRIAARLLQDFGPASTADMRSGRLVIATQVVEQSLDVDFDDMATDLAPIDLVIQRAGRLQRHRRDAAGNPLPDDAPDGRGGARLSTLSPEPVVVADAKWVKTLLPKTARVYPDHGKLWLTACWLAENGGFSVPGQAREMIEAVYDDESLDRVPESLQRVSLEADGQCRSGMAMARNNLLDFDAGYSPTSLQWQDEGEAPTRLGEPTVRVRLARVLGESLVPWAEAAPDIAWALSELSVPQRLIAAESIADMALIQTAKAAMRDEGRYVVVVALRPVGAVWRGRALGKDSSEVHVAYSPEFGLTIEKGAEDESDQ